MCVGITTEDCGGDVYQYLGWWPSAVPAMAPAGQLHSLRRGGDPPIGPRAPRRMLMVESPIHLHVPSASNHSNSCQRVPLSDLNPQPQTLCDAAAHHHVYLTMGCSLLHRVVAPRGKNMALPFMRRFPPLPACSAKGTLNPSSCGAILILTG